MYKILFFAITFLLIPSSSAEKLTILIKEKDTIHQQRGDIETRYSPCSSFKIALSLMGYDGGFLTDENNPEWPYLPTYVSYLERWKAPHTPLLWMKNSCVWYSQVLTQKMGFEKFQSYVQKFDYGNQDVSGDKGENNGLTHAWLSSSLEISAKEQVAFLERFLDHTLPVSSHAEKMTHNILFLEDLQNGWKLYGKTGSGFQLDQARRKLDLGLGWFVGWIEKGDRKVVFAFLLLDEERQESYAGLRAKEKAIEMLKQLATSL